jgi:hypothetical protein
VLVVVEDPRVDRVELEAVQERLAELRMRADDALLLRRQPAGLLEER